MTDNNEKNEKNETKDKAIQAARAAHTYLLSTLLEHCMEEKLNPTKVIAALTGMLITDIAANGFIRGEEKEKVRDFLVKLVDCCVDDGQRMAKRAKTELLSMLTDALKEVKKEDKEEEKFSTTLNDKVYVSPPISE